MSKPTFGACDECDGTGEVSNPSYDPNAFEMFDDYDESEQIQCPICFGTGSADPNAPSPYEDTDA